MKINSYFCGSERKEVERRAQNHFERDKSCYFTLVIV